LVSVLTTDRLRNLPPTIFDFFGAHPAMMSTTIHPIAIRLILDHPRLLNFKRLITLDTRQALIVTRRLFDNAA